MTKKWSKATEARTRAMSLFMVTLESIRRDLQQMLLMPSLDISYDIIEAYGDMLTTTLSFCEAVSESNPGYWRRDLPQEAQDDIALAQHALRLLQRAYGPQEATQP